jgi:hypothetical protein
MDIARGIELTNAFYGNLAGTDTVCVAQDAEDAEELLDILNAQDGGTTALRDGITTDTGFSEDEIKSFILREMNRYYVRRSMNFNTSKLFDLMTRHITRV